MEKAARCAFTIALSQKRSKGTNPSQLESINVSGLFKR